MGLLELYQRGQQLYNMFLEYKAVKFIICPCSLGDTVNVLSFLSTYKKVHGIDKVVVVAKEHQQELVKMFKEVADVFTLENDDIVALRVYIVENDLYDYENVLYGYFISNKEAPLIEQTTKFINFVDEYKANVLKIPLDSSIDEPCLPPIELDIQNKVKGSVIIMPSGLTLKQTDNTLWRMIIDHYKNNGVIVYTNVGNPGDIILDDTIELCMTIPELLSSAHLFKRIIGIRSGIFDVLALRSDISVDVITPGIVKSIFGKCEIDTYNHPLYFGLKMLNPSAKIREYYYSAGYEKMLCEEIFAYD